NRAVGIGLMRDISLETILKQPGIGVGVGVGVGAGPGSGICRCKLVSEHDYTIRGLYRHFLIGYGLNIVPDKNEEFSVDLTCWLTVVTKIDHQYMAMASPHCCECLRDNHAEYSLRDDAWMLMRPGSVLTLWFEIMPVL